MLGKYGRSSLCGGCRIQGWLWQPTGTLGVGRGETFKDRKRYATPVYLPDASASSAGLLRCTALANSHSGSIYLHEIYINYQDYTGPVYIIQLCKHVGICIYGSVSRVAPPPHGMVPPPLPPYLIHFAHATVAKRTFPYFCMHAAVAKRAFSFCWMNPPAGFGGSIARNCGEMQVLSSRNCSAQCTGHFNAQQMESYTYTYPCTYTFININNYICKNIYVYLHIHICTYPFHHIHIHIDIFIYT